MHRLTLRIVPFLLSTIFLSCYGYPSGAPLEACSEMRPYHPPTTTSGTAPFEINITATSYLPGEEITGSVYSPSGVKFRGLLLEARLLNGTTSQIGEFIIIDNNTHTNCGEKNKQALTHKDNSNKTNVDFKWKAPSSSMGDIHFKLTIVESYNVSRFWLDILSSNVTDFCMQNPTSSKCADVTTAEPITTTHVDTSTTPSSGDILWDAECGKTKGCFPECPNGCEYLVKWQTEEDDGDDDDDDVTNFDVQMKVKSTSDMWVAIGFAPTTQMDGTDVVACMSEGTNVYLQSSYNNGHVNNLYKGQKTVGLSHIQASHTEGKISFSFKRKNHMDDMDHFQSLKKKLYLEIAQGPIQQGVKQQHSDLPIVSSSSIDFLKNKVAKESDSASTLIKLHGSLMVVAWILCSTIGVVAARHCKDMLQNKVLCSVKYWFVIHRTLMFTAVTCVIAAMVIIFYENGGFQQITSVARGKEYTKAHPYLGIVVTVLALINPLMAVVRPSPDHPSRPMFNWAHFTVGTAAHIIAVITVFLGIHLSKAKVNEYAEYVVIVYYVIFVLVQCILEIHKKCNKNNYSTNVGDYSSFTDTTDMKESFKSKESSVPSTILMILAACCLAITVLLIVMICDPKKAFS
ncbi:DOMON domain-containing protein frrs1L [Mactra antiquata]